jgi:translation initiation factor IF-2
LSHVNHGKTPLLGAIDHANVIAGEAGGIKYHVSAYQIQHKGKMIAFFDTPGHAAFPNMLGRGASLTDVRIRFVAADDGLMSQTDNA